MKIYKILYSLSTGSFETRLFASNSEKEAIEELKKEYQEKYNEETANEVIVTKIEKM